MLYLCTSILAKKHNTYLNHPLLHSSYTNHSKLTIKSADKPRPESSIVVYVLGVFLSLLLALIQNQLYHRTVNR